MKTFRVSLWDTRNILDLSINLEVPTLYKIQWPTTNG